MRSDVTCYIAYIVNRYYIGICTLWIAIRRALLRCCNLLHCQEEVGRQCRYRGNLFPSIIETSRLIASVHFASSYSAINNECRSECLGMNITSSL